MQFGPIRKRGNVLAHTHLLCIPTASVNIIRYSRLLCNIDGEKKSLSRDWERLSFFYAKNLRLLMTASTTRAAELMVIRVRWVKM